MLAMAICSISVATAADKWDFGTPITLGRTTPPWNASQMESPTCGELLSTKEYEKALDCYDKKLRVDSQAGIQILIANDLYGMALAYYGLGKYGESLSCFEDVIRLAPSDPAVWVSKGILLEALGNYSDAVQCYRVAIQLNSMLPLAWYKKGQVLAALGRLNESLTDLSMAVQLEPSNGEYILARNLVLEKLGRPLEEGQPICSVRTERYYYHTYETVNIYYSVTVPIIVGLIIIGPAGNQTSGLIYRYPGTYVFSAKAIYPYGIRKVLLMTFGDVICSSTCQFEVVF
jgi:tetratricopeptide (TPR) repeat protein